MITTHDDVKSARDDWIKETPELSELAWMVYLGKLKDHLWEEHGDLCGHMSGIELHNYHDSLHPEEDVL